MYKILILTVALFLVASSSAAPTEILTTTTQTFQTGWDHFSEPLNLSKSNVKWSISASRKLTVTFTLAAATPNKLYQVGIHIVCTTSPGVFGQFPTNPASGPCGQLTRQNVTESLASVEFGVVTTDMHGNGSFKVVVGPIKSGTYEAEFTVRDGAGCNLIGGSGNANCAIDFQSPGPFGTNAALVVP